jgi:hypothetical protein
MQLFVSVLNLIKLLGSALEPTSKVSIVSDKGQGQPLLDGGDEVGPHSFYHPRHVLIEQVEGPWMIQDMPHLLEAVVAFLVMTDSDGFT